jgi:hypothetical protein
VCDSAEFQLEFLVGRGNNFSISALHGTFHRSREVGYRAGPVAFTKCDFVRIIDQMIIGERLEELRRFKIMVMSSSCRFGLTRSIHGDGLYMALPERFPKRAPRSRIPGIIQRFHEIQIFFNTHLYIASPFSILVLRKSVVKLAFTLSV